MFYRDEVIPWARLLPLNHLDNASNICIHGAFPELKSTCLGVPRKKDHFILVSILGSPYYEKLSHEDLQPHLPLGLGFRASDYKALHTTSLKKLLLGKGGRARTQDIFL